MASSSSNIAFNIGSGQVGSAIFAQTMSAHSLIWVPPELQLIFGYAGKALPRYGRFSAGENLERQQHEVPKIPADAALPADDAQYRKVRSAVFLSVPAPEKGWQC